MSDRLQDILAGCGDGNPTVNISAADGEAVGLAAGQYTADELRKACGVDAPKKKTSKTK